MYFRRAYAPCLKFLIKILSDNNCLHNDSVNVALQYTLFIGWHVRVSNLGLVCWSVLRHGDSPARVCGTRLDLWYVPTTCTRGTAAKKTNSSNCLLDK